MITNVYKVLGARELKENKQTFLFKMLSFAEVTDAIYK